MLICFLFCLSGCVALDIRNGSHSLLLSDLEPRNVLQASSSGAINRAPLRLEILDDGIQKKDYPNTEKIVKEGDETALK
jgi:hypothetical protein